MVQLAGREARWMAEAAKIAEGEGADIIDINMGCPAKKVIGGYSGAALMRDPDLALSLVEATVAAVNVPVTVKMRLGWDETSLNAPEIAKRCEDAGVTMITVHGRTRMSSTREADWGAIPRRARAISLPLIAMATCLLPQMRRRSCAARARMRHGRNVQARASRGFAARLPEPAKRRHVSEIAEYREEHYGTCCPFYGVEGGLRHPASMSAGYLDRHATAVTPAIADGHHDVA